MNVFQQSIQRTFSNRLIKSRFCGLRPVVLRTSWLFASRWRYGDRKICLPISALIILFLYCLPVFARQAPQDEVPLAPQRVTSQEAYRIRIENNLQGSIRISADGGLHYTLIGRVTRPASAVQLDRSASVPGRNSGQEWRWHCPFRQHGANSEAAPGCSVGRSWQARRLTYISRSRSYPDQHRPPYRHF